MKRNLAADPEKVRFVGLEKPEVAAWHIAVAKGHHNTPPSSFDSLSASVKFHHLNEAEMSILIGRLKDIYDPRVVESLMRCGSNTPAAFYSRKLRRAGASGSPGETASPVEVTA